MNKVYKTVWNEHTGQVVVVSELTKSRGKRTASSVASQGAHPFRILSSKVATLALASAGMLSLAMPGAVFAQDGIKFEADTGTTSIVELGDTLGIKGGENIETSVDSNDDNTVTIGLKEEIDLGGSGSLTIGSTVVDSAGLSFGISGPSITNSGIDAGGAPITNVADGTSADHAATVGQVDAVQSTADSAMQSFVTKADGYAGETVDKGNPEANFLSGNNIALQADANGITVATKDEVTFDKVTIDGGGPVLDSDGINAGGKKITNVADGTTDGDAVNYGQLFGNKAEGIKYFRAKSDKDDAEAAGEDSVAIGPEAKAEGDQSLAAGVGAVADGPSTIAIGEGAEVEKDTDDEDSEGAIAIGKGSKSKGAGSLAAGRGASASGAGALALGDDSSASGTAVAIGAGSVGTSDGTAIGPDAEARAPGNVSVGHRAGENTHNQTANDWQQNTAVGALSGRNVEGQVNTALGYNAGNHIKGNHNVSIGNKAGNNLPGDSNISIGLNANKDTIATADNNSIERSIALGEDSTAQTDAIAMGHLARADQDSLAIGGGAKSTEEGVALGNNAIVTGGNSVALGANSIADQGNVVSVGSATTTRRITNVAKGVADTDAVNLGQLNALIDKGIPPINYDNIYAHIDENWDSQLPHYVSINDGGVPPDEKGNYYNDGAIATDTVAIGPNTKATEDKATAVGERAKAEGESSIAMGSRVKSLALNATTIGNSGSEARDESSIAIGTHVKSRDENSIVIGRDSYSDRQGSDGPSVQNSIVIGTSSASTAEEGIVLGKDALVNAPRGMAQGSNAKALANDAIAMGTESRSTGGGAIAQGRKAESFGSRTIAIGDNSTSGTENPEDNEAREANRDSIAIGTRSVAQRESSIAMGTGAQATAKHAIAMGAENAVTGSHSGAFGSNNTVSSNNAFALGNNIGISGTNHDGSVVLGHDSTIADAAPTSNASLNGIEYGEFAGKDPESGDVVSVGLKGGERQIQNVAAGRISADSTDAINGSQLYWTNDRLGNVANSTVSILGGNAKLGNDGTITMSNIGGTGKDTIHEAIPASRTKLSAGTNVASVNENEVDGHFEYTIDAKGASVSVENGLTVSSSTDSSTNITDYTVGFSQDTKDSLGKADTALQNFVTKADGTTAETINKDNPEANFKSGKNIKLQANSDGITVATEDDVDFSTVDITNNLTVSGDTKLGDNFHVSSSGDVTYNGSITGDNHIVNKKFVDDADLALIEKGLDFQGDVSGTPGKVHRKLGETLGLVGGENETNALTTTGDKNIGVIRNEDKDGYEILLAKNLTGLESIAINSGPTINNLGIDMGDKKITNLLPGTTPTDAVNLSQLQNVQNQLTHYYSVKGNKTAAGSNYDNDGATGQNALAAGVDTSAAGDSATAIGHQASAKSQGSVALGQAAKTSASLSGTGQIAIGKEAETNGKGALAVGLNAQALSGGALALGENATVAASTDSSLAIGKSAYASDNYMTIIGGSAGGNNTSGAGHTIVGYTAGSGMTGQDNTAIGRNSLTGSKSISGGFSETTAIGVRSGSHSTGNFNTYLGGNAGMMIQGSNNTFVGHSDNTQTSHTVEEASSLGSKTIVSQDGGVALGYKSVADRASGISGYIPNGANGDAITNTVSTTGAISVGSDTIRRQITNVAAGTEDTDAVNVAQLKAVNEIATTGWTLTDANSNNANIGPDGTVTFLGDDNVSVTQTGDDQDGAIAVRLNKDINLGNDGSIRIGNTVMNTGGLAILNGPSITIHGIDAGDKNITNVADGTQDDHAVNLGQLKEYETDITEKGMNFAGNKGDTIHKNLGDTLSIVGGLDNDADASNSNLRVDSDGDKLVIRMAKDLRDIETIKVDNSITIGDDVDNQTIIKEGDITTNNLTVKGVTKLGEHFRVTQEGDVHYDGDITEGTHIVNKKYVDEEVGELAATPLTFAGDTGSNIDRKLGETINLVGGADDEADLTDGNIGIVADGDDTLEIKLAKNINLGNDGSIRIGNTVMNTGGLAILDGPSITIHGIDAGGMKIKHVADGNIGPNSRQAINGRQLYAMGNSITQFLGDGVTFEDGVLNFDGYFEGIFGPDSDIKTLAQALEPWTVGADGGNSEPVLPGDNVDFSGAGGSGGGSGTGGGSGGNGNIEVDIEHDGDDHNVTFDLADNVTINESLTVGDPDGDDPYVTMGNDGNEGSAGSVTFYGEPDTDGSRSSASQSVVQGPGGVGTDQEELDTTRLGYTDEAGNEQVLATLNDGLSFGSNEGDHNAPLNTQVDIVGAAGNTDWSEFDEGQNIMTKVTQSEKGIGEIMIALANDLDVNSVTANSVEINNGPVINENGINMQNKRITNLADGVDPNDAVNVSQLETATTELKGQIYDIRRDMRRQNKKLSAGIAAAMATAGLPQAYMPGKSMMAVAGATWNGESGMAVGLSTISDNGHWVVKATGNASSRGNYGGSLGVGYQW